MHYCVSFTGPLSRERINTFKPLESSNAELQSANIICVQVLFHNEAHVITS